MHRLLKRQLKKLAIDPDSPPDVEQWELFLERINQTYLANDEDRDLIERSLSISSNEKQELYENFRQTTDNHISILTAANEELERQINERILAEQALQEQRDFLQQVIDINPLFIFAKDRQNRYTLANLAFAKAYGATVDEILGKTDADFHSDQEVVERYHSEDRFVMETRQEVFIAEGRSVKPSGQVFWRQITKRPMIDSKGEVNQLLGVVVDITDHKVTQEKLVKFTSQLRTAAEISEQISTVLDPDILLHEIVTVLQKHFDLYQVSVFMLDEIGQALVLHASGGEVSQMLLATPRPIPITSEKSLVAQAYRDKKIVVANEARSDPRFLSHPMLPLTQSEVSIPMLVGKNVLGILDLQASSPHRFSQSDLDTFSVLAGQISVALENAYLFAEQRRVEKALALARDHAIQAALLKGQLLANVSHDLRTPLGAIMGHTEMLQKGLYGSLSDKQLNITKRILASTTSLTRMVNRLMTQAQLDAGALQIKLTSFAPGDLCKQIQSNMKVLADSKGLELICSTAENINRVDGDFDWVYQILANLVENALKFTQQGKIEVKIYQPDQKHWAMRVSDSGPGIPAEAQDYIFEAFRQVDGTATRKHKGAGLGLSIVKQLATMMGGEITLESKVGHGSTFIVLLPFTPLPETNR